MGGIHKLMNNKYDKDRILALYLQTGYPQKDSASNNFFLENIDGAG
jgi:hypothetical protein